MWCSCMAYACQGASAAASACDHGHAGATCQSCSCHGPAGMAGMHSWPDQPPSLLTIYHAGVYVSMRRGGWGGVAWGGLGGVGVWVFRCKAQQHQARHGEPLLRVLRHPAPSPAPRYPTAGLPHGAHAVRGGGRRSVHLQLHVRLCPKGNSVHGTSTWELGSSCGAAGMGRLRVSPQHACHAQPSSGVFCRLPRLQVLGSRLVGG